MGKFDLKKALEICSLLATKPFPENSMTRICKDETLVCRTTFYYWRMRAKRENATPEEKQFLTAYAEALEIKQENMLDEIIDVVYDDSKDMTPCKNGSSRPNNAAVTRSALKANNLKWALSKLNPDKFGNKLETTHSGEINITPYERLIKDLSDDGQKKQR